MAKTTLLPTPLQSGNVNENFKSSQKTLLQTQESVKNIGELLVKRTKVRKEIFSSILEDRKKRDLATRRREREDEIETKKTVFTGGIDSALQAASASGGSFLGKLVKALGFITAGWILRRLPTWIGYAKEFIARVEELGRITRSFVGNITSFFSNLFNTLGELKNNLLRFDLFDSQRNVRNSFDELTKSIDGMEKDFEDAINVFTTDLTKQIDGVRVGSYSGEEVPEQKEGFTPSPPESIGEYESAPSSSGSTVSGDAIDKKVLDLIADGEASQSDPYGGFNTSRGKTSGRAVDKTIGWLVQNAQGAIGRYQHMPRYLMDRAIAAGYNANTKFTPEVQDKITIKFLEDAHSYREWKSGKLSDEDFLSKLAPTWRAIPQGPKNAARLGGNPNSTYNDQYAGGNRAKGTWEQRLNRLKSIKSSSSQTSQQTSQQAKASPQQSALPSNIGTKTGLVTGYGGGTPFHVDTRWARDLPMEVVVPMIDSMAKSLAAEGRVMEMGTAGSVTGKRYPLDGTFQQKKEFLQRATAGHHSQRSMAAFDYFIPKSSEDRFGKSAEFANIPAPALPPGYKINFYRGSAADGGAFYEVTDPSGRPVFKTFHGDPSKSNLGLIGQKQELAKVTPPPSQPRQQVAQQITPERKAQDIVAVVPPSTPQQPAVSQGPSPSQQQTAPSIGDMLNNFIKQKFLLDLSFL